jgi:putative NADPH-quinone reductase
MSREERLGYLDTAANIDTVREYVERLKRAEALVLSFPVWNYGFPAILKGFFDRVFLPGVSFELVNGKVRPSLHNIRKVAAVTSYGGSRFRAILMGDPPRKIINRLIRATIKPGAPVSYLAHYSMNLSTERTRSAFQHKVKAAMDAF